MKTGVAVKIFGERNTGTNYLVRLLQLNVESEILRGTLLPGMVKAKEMVERISGGDWRIMEAFTDVCFAMTKPVHLGWKHAAPDLALLDRYSRKRPLAVITMTRNPYSWLLALHKRPYHACDHVKNRAIEKFLDTRWKSVARENGPAYFETPMHLWNYKSAALLKLDALAHARVKHVSFEDLLQKPGEWVAALVKECGLAPKGGPFQNHHVATKSEEGRDHQYYRDYYGRELWKEKLSPELVGLINRHLDLDLCRRLGYEVLGTDGSPA
jgi:hypothetical protein